MHESLLRPLTNGQAESTLGGVPRCLTVQHSVHLKPRLIPSSEDTRAPVQAKESQQDALSCWHQMRVLCKSHVLRTQVATSCGTLAVHLHPSRCTSSVSAANRELALDSLSLYLCLSSPVSLSPSALVAVPNCALLELLRRGGQETHRKRIMTGVTYMSARDRREISFLARE